MSTTDTVKTPYPWDRMDQMRHLANEARAIDACAYLLKGARNMVEMGRFKLPSSCRDTMTMLVRIEDELEALQHAAQQVASERLSASYKVEERLALDVAVATHEPAHREPA